MTEAKDFLLANMYEEEIGGDRHTDLLIRFAEACGTTRERVVSPDNMSPTTRGLQSWCYAVAMREDPVVAVAGLVVGLESQVPSIYRKQTRRCARSMASPTRKSSSSTSTSCPTRSTASAATRSCWSTPTRPSCSNAA
jgi:pyrroloquinoline-quinone synthase